MKEKILITGVAGFLGSALAKALVASGQSVVGVDDSTAAPANRLEGLPSDKFTFVKADIRNASAIRKAMSDVAKVVHLAEKRVDRSGRGLEVLAVNAEGTQSLLESVRDYDVHFILGSSSLVYGKCPESSVTESGPLVLGNSEEVYWSYPASKLMAEHFTIAYGEKYHFPTTILRFGSLYGPGLYSQGTEWTVVDLLQQALRGQVLNLEMKAGTAENFTFVADAVKGILKALNTPRSHGEIFNIASPQSFTLEELALVAWRLAGLSGKPLLKTTNAAKAMPFFTNVRRCLSMAHAESVLGYQAETMLSEGLAMTLEWLKKEGHPASLGEPTLIYSPKA